MTEPAAAAAVDHADLAARAAASPVLPCRNVQHEMTFS